MASSTTTSNRAKTTTIRLATASPGTRATTRETLAQLRGIAERASSGGADLLLLPEAYLGGYPRGADFGCRVGARDPAGRDAFLDYFRAAVDLGDVVGDACAGAGDAWVRRQLPVPSEGEGGAAGEDGKKAVRGDGTREEIESIARDTGVFLILGLIEKVGGSLYCAAGYVCPRLGFIGKRRKVMPVSGCCCFSFFVFFLFLFEFSFLNFFYFWSSYCLYDYPHGFEHMLVFITGPIMASVVLRYF